MERLGLVHIYSGDGKGKTTAACGLALRCLGHGGKVLFFQFLKSADSGEVRMLEKLDGITVRKVCERVKFFCDMTEEEKEQARTMYRTAIDGVLSEAGGYDMLVLDEVLSAIETLCCPEDAIIEFLKTKPASLEVVMTGRNPSQRIADTADYISRIEKVRHPFDKGIGARKMIEF